MKKETVRFKEREVEEDYSRVKEEPKLMKETYKIKSRTLGSLYVSFSHHAHARLVERGLNLLEVLSSLAQGAEALNSVRDDGDVLLVNTQTNCCIVLSVSSCKDVLYFNLITVMAEIPTNDDGQLRFHQIKHFISI